MNRGLLQRFISFWKTPVGPPAFCAATVASKSSEALPGPAELLADLRNRIIEHANNDPDKWFYANRFIFARLQLDERKTKVRVKKFLIDAGAPCHRCGKPFVTNTDIHLHRTDGERGYSRANCVLMHPECHRAHHSESASERPTYTASDFEQMPNGVISKVSKRYIDKDFIYWWDVSPTLHARLSELSIIEFIQKDTGQKCLVEAETLRKLLTPERQTSRNQGAWGVRVLKNRPNYIAVESTGTSESWPSLSIVWLNEDED